MPAAEPFLRRRRMVVDGPASTDPASASTRHCSAADRSWTFQRCRPNKSLMPSQGCDARSETMAGEAIGTPRARAAGPEADELSNDRRPLSFTLVSHSGSGLPFSAGGQARWRSCADEDRARFQHGRPAQSCACSNAVHVFKQRTDERPKIPRDKNAMECRVFRGGCVVHRSTCSPTAPAEEVLEHKPHPEYYRCRSPRFFRYRKAKVECLGRVFRAPRHRNVGSYSTNKTDTDTGCRATGRKPIPYRHKLDEPGRRDGFESKAELCSAPRCWVHFQAEPMPGEFRSVQYAPPTPSVSSRTRHLPACRTYPADAHPPTRRAPFDSPAVPAVRFRSSNSSRGSATGRGAENTLRSSPSTDEERRSRVKRGEHEPRKIQRQARACWDAVAEDIQESRCGRQLVR